MVTAHHLRDCSHVLEIGGHLHPLTELLQKAVTVVDPHTTAYFEQQGRHVKRHMKITWQEWQRSAMVGDEDCFAYLGAPVIDSDLSDFLRQHDFKLVMFEYARGNLGAAHSTQRLLQLGIYETVMLLGMDMGTDAPQGRAATQRQMVLLRPRHPYPMHKQPSP